MNESASTFFEPTFDRSVKVRARDHRLSSDGGVLLLREVDDRLGLTESIYVGLYDPRCQHLVRYDLDELLRERLYSRVLGYNADDEVDLLAQDPAFRIATWDRRGDRVLDERCASQPTQSRLTDILANNKGNTEALRAALPDWVGRHLLASGGGHAAHRGTLDIDSFPMVVCGSQEGACTTAITATRSITPWWPASLRTGATKPSPWRRLRSRCASRGQRKRPVNPIWSR